MTRRLLFSLFFALAACSGPDDGPEPVRTASGAAKAAGQACTAGSECDSGFCVDGVCCTTDCKGTCQACAAEKKQSLTGSGTCGAALEGLDPHDDCAADAAGTCGKTGACDGKGACALTPQGAACVTDAGAGNTCNVMSAKGAICSGTGVCYFENAPAGKPCAPYVCKNGSCAFPCANDADCQPPNRCELGVCKPKRANGTPCKDKLECDSGNCTDGVCCDSNCSGQCQACNLVGKVGTCAFVTGTPLPPRQDCTGSGACKGTCAGNGDKCSYPGNATSCGAASCTGDVSTSAATCDGTGACAAGQTSPCSPYGCDAANGLCRKACASSADCSQGATCDSNTGKCAISTAKCLDPTTVQLPNGQTESCTPYVCKAGKCQQQCSTGADCAFGYACQGASCVADADGSAGGVGGGGGASSSGGATATGGKSGGGDGSSDDAGCGCRTAPKRENGLAALALLALVATARRRRSR
ncbi:MAG: hypothetical protein IT377_31645 [Polyangiaceae bacterium]|nr:hypothetical protein [Polyangiaceae bacterium]